MRNSLLYNRLATIGIGALIVFIALILIAGMAANAIIQTSGKLESQTRATGSETTTEVGAGVAIYAIEGFAGTGSDISKLAIMVRPRAGTDSIDISSCYLELSNSSKKMILNYTTSYYSKPNGFDNIFSASVFPDDDANNSDHNNNRDGSRFGILVVEDADNSVLQNTPLINRGDKVCLCINTTSCFNNITEKTDIWGAIVPEEGSLGGFEFRTPSTYSDSVMELLYNLP
jgi:flagellin FlaB